VAHESLPFGADVAEGSVPLQRHASTPTQKTHFTTLLRVAKYTAVRAVLLGVTLIVGLYLAVIIINYGGFIDQIYRDNIEWALLSVGQSMRDVPMEEKLPMLEQMRWEMEEAAGLHDPFLGRCAVWLWGGLSFEWGEASVLQPILERLANTLLLAGSANLLLFFSTLFLALVLSRQFGSWLDKILIALSPLSAAPNWVYGILLTLIFAVQLRLLPLNGMLDPMPPATKLGYIPIVLKHMLLPVTAIFLSVFFQGTYAWRTFFLLHSREDYVEMAEAKGLPNRMIERRYILRPTLPYILTSFTLLLISFWQGAMALELFFHWPGIGAFFVESIWRHQRTTVLGLLVMFAYLLALSVFLLDILYALVDPRVRIGGQGETVRTRARLKGRAQTLRHRLRSRLRRGRLGRSRPDGTLALGRAESAPGRARVALGGRARELWRSIRSLAPMLREIARYPSALVGLVIVVLLVGIALYTLVAIPYEEAVQRWRGDREDVYRNPKLAQPEWVNLFRRNDLPATLVLDSRDAGIWQTGTSGRTAVVRKSTRQVAEDVGETTISFAFDYPYAGFPQDLAIYLSSSYSQKKPFVSLALLTPDGRQVDLGGTSITSAGTYLASADAKLRRRTVLGGEGGQPTHKLFGDPEAEELVAVQGAYELLVTANTFEADSEVDAEFVLYGQVYGPAGTDHRRRDLGTAMLWGAPVALAFGLLGAVVTSLVSMVASAAGVWFGGRADDLVQRITEVSMIIPALPLAITAYLIYDKSIWVVLGLVMLLNVFSGATKNYRAIFLQVKAAPYIEAARVYGASGWRVIVRYLVPRILPVLIPQLVILIPGYVFLEATLAYLGVRSLYLPTWGKVISDALTNQVFEGHYYWVLQPVGLLLLTGLAFAMVGFALDTIFNPRLRER
jgi:peptide/nickel transport system permease protein